MASESAGYEYDVFFSYKRHGETLEWNRQVRNKLKFWLGQELDREPTMFVDEESIDTGQVWPDALKRALKASRCMVCVWWPYFQSAWCLSEWRSFRAREDRLGRPPHALIAPLRFQDGEHFPADARDVQWIDVEPYAYTLPAFWNTSKALDLEERLKKLSKDVAKIVAGAPAFEDWPIVDVQRTPPPKIGLAKL